MNEPIETIELKDLKIKIYVDEAASSPRTAYNNLGTMACNDDYGIGDNYGFYNLGAVLRNCLYTDAVFIPIYIKNYNGNSIITTDVSEAVLLKLQASQLGLDALDMDYLHLLHQVQGILFCDAEKIIDELGNDSSESRQKVIENFKSEIDIYNQYLRGEVYGYVIEKEKDCKACKHSESLSIDSCWGFYGIEDVKKEALASAKDIIKSIRKNSRHTG